MATATPGRLLAIGDVHGCLQALERLITLVDPQPEDHLVFLGDYVDRGPDSRGVIDWLLTHVGDLQLTTIRGNHDQVMLDARHDPDLFNAWQTFGGTEALASYGVTPEDDWVAAVPDSHWDFLASTELYLETPKHIFVHGALEPHLPPAQQSPRTLMWARFHDIRPHQSGKRIICGHTSQKGGIIAALPHAVCIDTWPLNAYLTCLDVNTGTYWQTRQDNDQVRTGVIGDR